MTRVAYINERLPKFKSVEEEASFWDTHDSTAFPEEIYPEGNTLQAAAYRWLRKKYPRRLGWIIASDPRTPSGKFADFVVRNKAEQIVVEIKSGRISTGVFEQMRYLQSAFNATSAILLCEQGTQISKPAQAIASKAEIQVALLPPPKPRPLAPKKRLAVAERSSSYHAG